MYEPRFPFHPDFEPREAVSFWSMKHSFWVTFLLFLLLFLGRWSQASARTLTVGKEAKTVQKTIQLAQKGDIVVIPKGIWKERVRVDKSITLRGSGGILDGGGKGKVLILAAPRIILEKLHIRNSGSDLGGPDSCVYLEKKATHSVLRHNKITDCAFGVWVHETNHVQILHNTVIGRSHLFESDRGNGIHLFDGSHLKVLHNRVRGARDGIYVSAVEHSLIEKNHLSHLRYGVHYMYSHYNILRRNLTEKNTTGFALMQSHHMTVVRNTIRHNKRHGILFRDAQYCTIQDNLLSRNGEGFFFFSSTDNTISHNLLQRNRIGARIWAGTRRNKVFANAFVGNARQIFYVGSSDLVWGKGKKGGNYWSDYTGWDQNGDGQGDRPYRLDSFTSHLLHRFPASVFLLRSPALELLAHLEQKLPLLRVPTVVDKRPLMKWKRRR